MDIVLLIFAVYTLCCLRPCGAEDEPLSTAKLLPVRGICALCIIFHHVAQRTTSDNLAFHYFSYVGFMFVGVFFTISGYALSSQYAAKGEKYLDGFLRKRLTTLLCPYIVMSVIFMCLYAGNDIMSGQAVLTDLLQRLYQMFRSGANIVSFSWYVETAVVLYILFYVSCKIAQNNKIKYYAVVIIGIGIYAAVCRILEYGDYWYNSALAFVFGTFYFEFMRSYKPLQNRPLVGAVLLTLCCGVTLLIKALSRGLVSLSATELAASFMPLAIFMYLQRIQIKSKLLDYIGSRSYEIYLAQGIPMLILAKVRESVDVPNAVYLLVTLAASVAIGEAVYRIDRRLIARLLVSKAEAKKV